mgnify:CR=1 FL=1
MLLDSKIPDFVSRSNAAGTVPKGDLLEILSQKATEEVTLINSENLLALAYLDLIQLLELFFLYPNQLK